MTYIPKRKGIKKLLILKKADPILTNGEISKSFHVDVSANVNEANCGKMTDYLRCMEEQKAKKTSDIQGLSSKYNFPVDFLKEAIQSINKLNEKERHKKMVSKFKQEIIDYCKKNYHYPVDRDSIRVDIDPELTALSQLYLENKWPPIFRHWQVLGEQQNASEVKSAEWQRNIGFGVAIAVWVLLVLGAFILKYSSWFFILWSYIIWFLFCCNPRDIWS